MSSKINVNQIAQILAQAHEQGIDLSSSESIKSFTQELQAKPAKVVREKKPLKEGEKQCMARVWGKGSGLDQCSNKAAAECDYCSITHKKEAEQSLVPCQFDENGKKYGLFCGRIDEPIPFLNTTGEIVIRWTSAEIKSQIAELEGGKVNSKAAKFTSEWYKFTSTKKVPTVTRVRKAKASQNTVETVSNDKAPVTKGKGKGKGKTVKDPNAPKKATNAFMFYSNEKRVEIKAQVLAEFIAANPDADEKAQKAAVAVGKVGQALGVAWNALSDEGKAPYKALETADKARYESEMTAYKASKAAASLIDELPAEEEEEKEATEEVETAQQESTEAEEVEIDGVMYLVDAEQNVYDTDCNPVGKLVGGKMQST